jgi:3-oxoacyl-[acyl-carrier-protein] synthase II
VSALAVTGLGVVAPTGVGGEPFARALAGDGGAAGATVAANGASPADSPFALPDFDVRALLGRKGTSTLDRGTGFALVACREALADSDIPTDGERRIGVIVGTTSGSLCSMSDYTRDTLVEERPYLVNPSLFPNTVINCASGQAAIRYGLRGINCTLAAGPIAFLCALRFAERALRLGHLDASLVGAVEELSPQRAWQTQLAGTNGAGPPPGEGAAVLVAERADEARAAGRRVDAVLRSVVTGFCPGGERAGGVPSALQRCAREALRRAGTEASEVAHVAVSSPAGSATDGAGEQALAAIAGLRARPVALAAIAGDCGAATAALQVAAILLAHREDPERDGAASLILGWTVDGGLGAAVLRGYSRAEAAG